MFFLLISCESIDTIPEDALLNIVESTVDSFDDFEGYLDAIFAVGVCIIEDYLTDTTKE